MAGSAGAVPAGRSDAAVRAVRRGNRLCRTAHAQRRPAQSRPGRAVHRRGARWRPSRPAAACSRRAARRTGSCCTSAGTCGCCATSTTRSCPRWMAAIEDLERALALIGPEWAARTDLTSVLDTARVMREQLIAPSGPGRPLGAATSTAFGSLLDAAARPCTRPGRVPHRCRAGGRRAGDARAGDGRRDADRSGDRPARRRRRDPRPRAARAAQGCSSRTVSRCRRAMT